MDRPGHVDRPPSWQVNPSTWSQRLPIVALALVGVAIAGYLTLFQVGALDTVWEPFFGDGSRRILNSRISHVLPVPDAALGAFGYLLDAVTGVIGGRARWRTMPWMVVLFGLAVGPLGVVSIMLVVFQPVLLDAWCTLCLASAVVSMLMIAPAMDEVLASLQFLRRARQAGRPFWKVFWGRGDQTEPFPGREQPVRKPSGTAWAQGVVAAVGLWLMAAPAVLGYADAGLATSDRIVGPILVSFGIIGVAEVTRPVRWVNVALGVWLLAAPFVVGAPSGGVLVMELAAGLAVVVLNGFRGRVKTRYGGGWSVLFGREGWQALSAQRAAR